MKRLRVIALVAAAALVAIGTLAVIASDPNRTKRSKIAEGLLGTMALKVRISEEFSQRPSDMSCSQEYCPLLSSDQLGLPRYVRRISSNRSGAIIIEFDEQIFAAPNNRLSIVPMIDGRPANLADSMNAGRTLTWKCGQDPLTTILSRYLPSDCK